MKNVEIIDNGDGSYSVWVFGIEVFRGSREQAEIRASFE